MIGTEVQIRVGRNSDEVTTARVTKVSGRGNSSGQYEVIAVLNRATSSFAPGATIDLAVPADEDTSDDMSVPVTAITPVGENRGHVFVIDPESGQISVQEVSIIRLVGEFAVIEGDISDGTTIVSRGVAFLSEGQRVSRLGVGPQRFE